MTAAGFQSKPETHGFSISDVVEDVKTFLDGMSESTRTVVIIVALLVITFDIVQAFLAFGTAYRCAKRGKDDGVALFIYMIGFELAALVPGLGLHYYIRNLPPKVVVTKIQKEQPIIYMQPQQQQMQQQMQQQPQQVRYVTPEQLKQMQEQERFRQMQEQELYKQMKQEQGIQDMSSHEH